MCSKRAANNKLYSTVSMTPGDENVQFSADEGIDTFLQFPCCHFFVTFLGPLYSDDNDDMPLDLNS